MPARPHLDDPERRARLARRHGLLGSTRLRTPSEVAEALVALHATDTATIHLSIAARTAELTVEQTTHAVGDGRELHRQLAMRRTQWAATAPTVAAMLAGPSVRVAEAERRLLAAELQKSGVTVDGERWIRRAAADVLDALADGGELSATEIAATSRRLSRRVTRAPGTKWSTEVGVAPRLLTILWAQGRVARAANGGSWVTNRSRWTTPERRYGSPLDLPEPRTAWALLVQRWLERFGPGTEKDLRWWFGTTAAIVRSALADVGAVEVSLDGGRVGWVAAGDEEPVGDPGRWAALLPILDPTTMGHKERDFYTCDHDAELYDSVGNGGTTVWVDGRMVGAWSIGPEGRVRLHLLETLDAEAADLVAERAGRIEAFIGGRDVVGMYSSPIVVAARRS